MHKPIVFYFTFANPESEDELTYGFTVNNPTALYAKVGVPHFIGLLTVLNEKVTDKLEGDYGVHDWSTAPTDGVDSIGYATYEVEDDQIDLLMGEWHKWFADHDGSPSNIVQIMSPTVLMDGDDMDIYNYISAACKQQ